jgi:general secretion pathway protein M
MNLKALRAMLHQLESGTPYVFVDALTVQPTGATAGRIIEDPLLRATLSLRAFWRRGTP